VFTVARRIRAAQTHKNFGDAFMSTTPSLGERVGHSIARAFVCGTTLLLFTASRLSFGSDGYTYTKVADFDTATFLCDFAINDNGDVAYVTQTSGVSSTQYDVHLWTPSGSDRVAYTATEQQNPSGDIWVPDCGGFGGGSLGVAINNNRLISIEAEFVSQTGVDGWGALFVDASVTPSTFSVVQTPTIFNSTSLLDNSGARGMVILTSLGPALGSVSPAGTFIAGAFDTTLVQFGWPAATPSR
jgi:hypothetical protein